MNYWQQFLGIFQKPPAFLRLGPVKLRLVCILRLLRGQGTVVLRVSRRLLIRKIEGSNLAANSYFSNERPRRARKKETNLETKIEDKARPQNERPLTRWTSALETKKTRSQALKREKETRFEGCEWIEWPVTHETKHSERRVEARRTSWRYWWLH